MPITRFAPSPTGDLHIGHAYSALFARMMAGDAGTMLLRIEDIDPARCNAAYIDGIERDLAWLGLQWPLPVRRQSAHLEEYRAALVHLTAYGVTYPCFCTRREIDKLQNLGLAAPHGRMPVYPGTCRKLSRGERQERIERGDVYAIRLNVAQALSIAGPQQWRDLDRGWILADPALLGDVIVARKDTPTSYHLSVTLDDAAQGVEIVTRGEDLFEATHIHRLLQALLGLPVPVWRHHRLLLDERGRRFAKRDRAPALKALREAGKTGADIRAMLGFEGKAVQRPAVLADP